MNIPFSTSRMDPSLHFPNPDAYFGGGPRAMYDDHIPSSSRNYRVFTALLTASPPLRSRRDGTDVRVDGGAVIDCPEGGWARPAECMLPSESKCLVRSCRAVGTCLSSSASRKPRSAAGIYWSWSWSKPCEDMVSPIARVSAAKIIDDAQSERDR